MSGCPATPAPPLLSATSLFMAFDIKASKVMGENEGMARQSDGICDRRRWN